MIYFFQKRNTCKAADFSLLFQPSGEVLPCHYNRGYILGKYPENSIREIWKGNKRKILVKSIRTNKYNLGCFACKNDIDNGLDQFVGKNKYNYIGSSHSNFPLSMEFQLDNICNLECIMCSGEYSSGIRKHREKGEKYLSPYDDKFIEQLEQFIPHLKHAAFTGGEPFLINIYYKLWDRIKVLNPDCNIYISTNGTVLNEKVKSYLERLSFNLTISIDSLDKERYEAIRKNATLEKTLENIEYFIQYCKEKNTVVNIKCLVMPQNYQDIPFLFSYFSKKNIGIFPKVAFLPQFASFESLNKNELTVITNFYKKQSFINQSEIQLSNIERFNELIRQIESINPESNNILLNTEMQLGEIKKEFENQLIENINKLDKSIRKDIYFYKKILELLYNSIVDENELKTAIINFSKLQPQLLLNEINRADVNKLIARFKQAALFKTSLNSV